MNKLILMMVVIAAAAATLLLLLYNYKQQQSSVDEHYEEPSLAPDAIAARYASFGVEKCSALDDASPAAKAFVDTLRLRRWKPAAGTTADNAAYDYCYFYADRDPSKVILDSGDQAHRKNAPVADPLSGRPCSVEGLFGGVATAPSVVADVFKDSTPEMTLNQNLAYEKCVLKLDRAAAASSASNVAQFYEALAPGGNPTCAGLLQTLKAERDKYLDAVARLREAIDATRARASDLETQTRAFKTERGVVPPEASWRDLEGIALACNNDLTALKTRYASESNAYAASRTAMAEYTREKTAVIEAASNAARATQSRVDALRARAQDLENSRGVYADEVRRLAAALSQASQKRDACTNALREEEKRSGGLVKELDARRRELEGVEAALTRRTQQRADLEADVRERTKQVAELDAQVQAARLERDGCQRRAPFFREEAARWAQIAGDAKRRYDACILARAPIIAQVEDVEKRVQALYAEIEDIKKRCRATEGAYYDANVQTARQMAEQTLETVQQQCRTVSNMKEKKSQLEQEIAQIKENIIQVQQAKAANVPCQQVTEICCKAVGRRGWNDDGKSGVRARTTTGRIDAIRDHMNNGGANYVRFVVENAPPTEFLKIVNTRRNRGGGSYVDVDRDVGRYGRFREFISYKMPA